MPNFLQQIYELKKSTHVATFAELEPRRVRRQKARAAEQLSRGKSSKSKAPA